VAVVDDIQLIQLAAHRSATLFPLLRRTTALAPLVVLLAVLPGLHALAFFNLDSTGALWGLKSLAVLQATTIDEFIAPSPIGAADSMQSQPPLGCWLTALMMTLYGTSRPVSVVLTSYLSTVGLVVVTYFLARRLGGPRVGFWAALLLACHGPILAQAQQPAPIALSSMLAASAILGFITHLQEVDGALSRPLLYGGIALGLCLLAGGALATVVVALLLIQVLWLRDSRPRANGMTPRTLPRWWVALGGLRSLAILSMTGFAVGGWWILTVPSLVDSGFWREWLALMPIDPDSVGLVVSSGVLAGLIETFARRMNDVASLLCGLSLLGVWRACREMFATNDEQRRRSLRLLLLWSGFAVVVWLWSASGSTAWSRGSEYSETFFAVPWVLLAAFAIEEIAQRRVHWLGVVAVVCLSILAIFRYPPELRWQELTLPMAIGLLTLAGVLIGLTEARPRTIAGDRDARLRLLLTTLVVGIVVANATAGLSSVQVADGDDQHLAVFREELSSLAEAGQWRLIAENDPPLPLMFLLCSLWPQADSLVVDDWSTVVNDLLQRAPDDMRLFVVVEWRTGETRPARIQFTGIEVDEVASPQRFQRRQLRGYVLQKADETKLK
jgi:4-amino-4-deoxy-L-arabinose transferase-like glycosyltransferase